MCVRCVSGAEWQWSFAQQKSHFITALSLSLSQQGNWLMQHVTLFLIMSTANYVICGGFVTIICPTSVNSNNKQ